MLGCGSCGYFTWVKLRAYDFVDSGEFIPDLLGNFLLRHLLGENEKVAFREGQSGTVKQFGQQRFTRRF